MQYIQYSVPCSARSLTIYTAPPRNSFPPLHVYSLAATLVDRPATAAAAAGGPRSTEPACRESRRSAAKYRRVTCDKRAHTNTHMHTFNGPFSRGTTQVSRYQKRNQIWILLKQETVSGSGISWAICKSAPRSRQITTPAPHHSVFYRPDALPAAQPTASKHWRPVPWPLHNY